MVAPARIVAVDDEPNVLFLIKTFLREAGHEVETAESGAAALSLLGRTGFDLAILDLAMPFMDGFELCARIRAAERSRRLPILFLTAHYQEDEWSVRARELGADDFAQKPITRRALCARVSALLRLARAGAADRGPSLALRAFFETALDGLAACVLAIGPQWQVVDSVGHVEQLLGTSVAAGQPLQRVLPSSIAASGAIPRLVQTALTSDTDAQEVVLVQEARGMRQLRITARRMPAAASGAIRAVLVLEEPSRPTATAAQRMDGVVDLQVADLAAAAADVAGAIENRSVDVLRSLRALGETGERVLRIAEGMAAATHGMEPQAALATLRAYWRSALKESALGAHGIIRLARELRTSSAS